MLSGAFINNRICSKCLENITYTQHNPYPIHRTEPPQRGRGSGGDAPLTHLYQHFTFHSPIYINILLTTILSKKSNFLDKTLKNTKSTILKPSKFLDNLDIFVELDKKKEKIKK